MVGKRVGSLTVISDAGNYVSPNGRKSAQFSCVCDCGQETVVRGEKLRLGATVSCGCARLERITKHGHCKRDIVESSTHRIWRAMRNRCSNPTLAHYKDYGGRGITVCERWLHSFENFLADMGERPSPQHSIDRYPDNDGNYEPGNCRWATMKEQAANKRPYSFRSDSHYVEFRGQKMTVTAAAKLANVKPATAFTRLRKGWPIEWVFI